MSFDALRKSIADRMTTAWPSTVIDLTRIVFGDNDTGLDTTIEPWARLSHNILDSNNAQLGKDFQRTDGIINVQVFVAKYTGEKAALDIVDDVITVFQNQEFEGVTCFAVRTIPVGIDGDSYQINAAVDFKYDVFS